MAGFTAKAVQLGLLANKLGMAMRPNLESVWLLYAKTGKKMLLN